MTSKSIRSGWLAGALGVGLLCLGGAASAQDYDSSYNDRTETLIVRPPYGEIQRERLPGWNGVGKFFNPEERISLSEPVNYSDLNLSYRADREELRYRISRTAMRICNRLAGRAPAGSVMETTQQECVRDAVRQALYVVPHR